MNHAESRVYPSAKGEVYELFIQLADPYCGIGFVTVAPIHHYVTGWGWDLDPVEKHGDNAS